MACLVLQFSVLKALNQFLGQWPNDKNNHHHTNNVEVGFMSFTKSQQMGYSRDTVYTEEYFSSCCNKTFDSIYDHVASL